MRFIAYPLIGAVVGGSIGAAGGFFGALEFARIMKVEGSGFGIASGSAYFGFYLMLILGALGLVVGSWRAWLLRNRAAALQQ